MPVFHDEAQTCSNGFSFLKDGTLGFSYASLTMTHSTCLCKPSCSPLPAAAQVKPPLNPQHLLHKHRVKSLPLPCPALITALYSFSLQMQGRFLHSKPILLEEFKFLLSLDSRILVTFIICVSFSFETFVWFYYWFPCKICIKT